MTISAVSWWLALLIASLETMHDRDFAIPDDPQPIYHRVNMDKFNSLHGFPYGMRIAMSIESFPRPAFESEAATSEIIYHKPLAGGEIRSYPVTSYRTELDALIELWQPSMYFVLNGPVSIDSQTSTVMAGVSGELLDGSELEMGANVSPSDAIWSGLILVTGEGSVVVHTPDGPMEVEIGALTLIVVRDSIDDPLMLMSCGSCSIVCNPSPSYFACCRFKQGNDCASCFCYSGQQPPQGGCNSGGTGASSCSVSDAGGPE